MSRREEYTRIGRRMKSGYNVGEGRRSDGFSRMWEGPMRAYCFRCKKQQEMRNPKEITLKNGRMATRGICSVCGGKISRMGGMK